MIGVYLYFSHSCCTVESSMWWEGNQNGNKETGLETPVPDHTGQCMVAWTRIVVVNERIGSWSLVGVTEFKDIYNW